MRHDWRPKHQAITFDSPVGPIYEMDVRLSDAEIDALTNGQLRPSARLVFEPWIRIRCSEVIDADGRKRRIPEDLDFGIEVIDQDDGA